MVLALGVGAIAVTGRENEPPVLPLRAIDVVPPFDESSPRYEYRLAEHLPHLRATAAAYRLGDDQLGRRIQRLAAALGLNGTLQAEEQGWSLTDGSRTLRVEKHQGAGWAWYMFDRTMRGLCPGEGNKCVRPTYREPRLPGLPSHAEAEARARAIYRLSGLGVECDKAAPFNTVDSVGVDLDECLVGGLPRHHSQFGVSFGQRGRVVRADGGLDALVRLGDYRLIGVDNALRVLRASGRGAGFAVEPEWPSVATVVSVDLVLERASTPDDSAAYLVPAYRFSLGHGEEALLVAVEGHYLLGADGD